MDNIKISNSDELIQFIENTDLSISNYQRIIKAYSGTRFFLTYRAGSPDFTQTDRQNLVSLIESKAESHINKGLPIMFAMGEPKGTYQKEV